MQAWLHGTIRAWVRVRAEVGVWVEIGVVWREGQEYGCG